MSIWGFGNFERDDALDVVDIMKTDIINKIRHTFQRPCLTTLYEDLGEAYIVANIDILSTLLENYQTYPSIELDEISRWKNEYLETFDRTIHVYDPTPEFVTKRRFVIAETFDRLYHIVDKLLQD